MSRPHVLYREDDAWIKHVGNRCPVDPDDIVLVIFANGQPSKEDDGKPASWWTNWRKTGAHHDIAYYRVIEEAQ